MKINKLRRNRNSDWAASEPIFAKNSIAMKFTVHIHINRIVHCWMIKRVNHPRCTRVIVSLVCFVSAIAQKISVTLKKFKLVERCESFKVDISLLSHTMTKNHKYFSPLSLLHQQSTSRLDQLKPLSNTHIFSKKQLFYWLVAWCMLRWWWWRQRAWRAIDTKLSWAIQKHTKQEERGANEDARDCEIFCNDDDWPEL